MSDFDLASWRARLGVACDGTRFSSVTVLPTCASTQDVAATLPKGSIVAAGEQASGRGRRGRAWSDGGGRSVSVSFVVDSMASARLSTASVLSVLDAMTSFGGRKGTVGCKFPNDVLACIDGGRKVAGVLVEGNADRMVIGIGLNVTPLAEEVRSISLEELGIRAARIDVMERLLRSIDRRLSCEVDRLRSDFIAHDVLRGRAVIVEHNQQKFSGTLVACDPFGTLVLDTAEGQRALPAEQCTLVEWSV